MTASPKKRSGGARRHQETIWSIFAGALLGLSAPGFDQWYLAWVGLAPLFLLCVSSPNLPSAFWRALLFGTAYNLVYWNWLLALHPLSWMGFAPWQSIGIAAFCWLFVAVHQGLLVSVFGVLLRLLPLTGGFIPVKEKSGWQLPAFLIVPPAWVILEELVLNHPDLLGVPWSMIEYSQYKQTALIQTCSVIGGVGLAVLMLASNVAIACLAATFTAKVAFKKFCAQTSQMAVLQALAVAVAGTGCLAYGFSLLDDRNVTGPSLTVSAVQPNINIEMQKTRHRYTSSELLDRYEQQLQSAPPGLAVLTESALPTFLKESPHLLLRLSNLAREKKLDMVIGAIDGDPSDKPFNGAFGMSRNGQLLSETYHKRYLVPVGEYTPGFVRYLPEFLQRLTDTPAGTGFGTGSKPVVLDFSGNRIAPLICFETIPPGLAVTSVRNGGRLLVNISDLAWFHGSMVGDQTTAFAIMRAVETRRYVVYAANTGPSLVIDPFGKIVAKTKSQVPELMTCRVKLVSYLTPFTQWFH